MIQIFSCPECQEPLLLEGPVSAQTRLGCPRCQYQFVLSERFAHWTVLDDPQPEHVNADHLNGYHVNGEPALDAQQQLPDADSPADTEEIRLSQDSQSTVQPKPKVNWSEVKPITHDEYERLKRRTRSPLWSMLQIALGGLAAVPISLLLLWHVFGKDFMDAGPQVARFVPWIVPEQFHPPESDSLRPPGTQATRGAATAGDGKFRDFDSELSTLSEPAGETHSGSTANNSSADAAGSPDAANNSEPWNSNQPTSNPGVSENSPNNPNDGDPAKQPQRSSGPTNSPDPNDFVDLIDNCETSMLNWRAVVRNQEPGDLRIIAKDIYGCLLQLADIIVQLPDENPLLHQIRKAMQPLGKQVKNHSDLQQLVQQGANYTAQQKTDQEYTLAIVIELNSVSKVGDDWQVTAATPVPVDNESLVIPGHLSPTLIVGQRLLLLGHVTGQSPPSNRPGDTSDDQPAAPKLYQFRACYLHGL